MRNNEVQIHAGKQIQTEYFGQLQKTNGLSLLRKNKLVKVTSSFFLIFVLLISGLSIIDSGGASSTPTEIKRKKIIRAKKAKPAAVKVPVLVARASIQRGKKLSPQSFSRELRAVADSKTKVIGEYDSIRNVVAARFIPKGRVLDQSYLAVKSGPRTITGKICKGCRAVTVTVDKRRSVEGWTIPGSHVDVYWTTAFNGERTLRMIAANAKVLSAERAIEHDPVANPQDGKKKSLFKSKEDKKKEQAVAPIPTAVTLLVSQKDAAKISFASTSGTLSLSLRAEGDADGPEDIGSITTRSVIGIGYDDNAEIDHDGIVRVKDEKTGQMKKYYLKNGDMIPAEKNANKPPKNFWGDSSEKVRVSPDRVVTDSAEADANYAALREKENEVVVRLVKYYD